jgi:hypothetical protein
MKTSDYLDMLDAAWQHQMRLAREHAEGEYEAEHSWLAQQVTGKCVDFACGNFPVLTEQGLTIGVDSAVVLGNLLNGFESLTSVESSSLDSLISNYLDAVPNVLEVLHEFLRCLKPSGTLALVVRDSESYADVRGPLCNPRRFTAFTDLTLSMYLSRAGFTDITTEKHDGTVRATARKPA